MKTRRLFDRCLTTLLSLTLLPGAFIDGAHAAQPSERQAKAMAMWQERCKVAGEKIYKTVENVDGIFLMKIRTTTNFGDQLRLDDPYGHDSTGDRYVLNFLKGLYHQRPATSLPGSPPRLGYKFVEAQDYRDGKQYRYTASVKEVTRTTSVMMGGDGKTTFKSKEFVLDREPSQGPAPRYGVTYDDISTREEREHWIAGSSLKVVDLQTKEVIAERIGYMMDWAQGSKAGGRSPWLFAADNACPGFQWNPNVLVRNGSGEQAGQTLIFVEKVLRPSK